MANINQRLNGQSPLNYQGVPAAQPTDFVTKDRDPLSTDSKNFFLGTWWLNTQSQGIWYLANITGDVATWLSIPMSSGINTLTGDTGGPVSPDGSDNIFFLSGYSGISIAGNPGTNTLTISGAGNIPLQYDTDSGTAVPSAGILNILGGLNIETSGAASTVTITTPVLAEGVIYADNSGVFSSLSKGTNGQLLIGATGTSPAWNNITSTVGTVTITNGANTVNIEVSGGGAPPPITTTVAFSAYKSAVSANVTGGGVTYLYTCDTELFDLAGSYNNATGIFTVPSDGYYMFYANAYVFGYAGSSVNLVSFYIKVTTPGIKNYFTTVNDASPALGYCEGGGWIAVSLVTGQQVRPGITIGGAPGTPLIASLGSVANRNTMFSGYKL